MSSVYDTVPPPTVRNFEARSPRVAIAIDEKSEHNFWSDLTFDVQHGGVFVATYHALPVGTAVELELGLAGETPTILQGVVRWTRAHRDGSDASAGFGIALLDVPPDAKARIDRFVEVRPPIVVEIDDPPRMRRSAPSVH